MPIVINMTRKRIPAILLIAYFDIMSIRNASTTANKYKTRNTKNPMFVKITYVPKILMIKTIGSIKLKYTIAS